MRESLPSPLSLDDVGSPTDWAMNTCDPGLANLWLGVGLGFGLSRKSPRLHLCLGGLGKCFECGYGGLGSSMLSLSALDDSSVNLT
jgi:hypothetical protein